MRINHYVKGQSVLMEDLGASSVVRLRGGGGSSRGNRGQKRGSGQSQSVIRGSGPRRQGQGQFEPQANHKRSRMMSRTTTVFTVPCFVKDQKPFHFNTAASFCVVYIPSR